MRLQPNNATEEECYIRLLDLIKQKGASLNLVANRGIAPIHEGTLRGNSIGVKWLIDNGSKVNNLTTIGFTPLHFAVQSKSMDVCKLLVKYNANPALKSQAGSAIEMAKNIDNSIFQYLSSVPAVSTPPRRPDRPKITSHRFTPTSAPSRFEESNDEEDDNSEVIYTIDDQDDDEEDVPGSKSAVIPLAQVIFFFYSFFSFNSN